MERIDGASGAAPSKSTIWVLDDDAAVRDSLQLLLELEGYAVKAFESVASFTKQLIGGDPCPHCIIADVHLPDGDGREVAAQIGRDHPTVPVILMSGRNAGTMHEEAAAAGAMAYFDKPIKYAELSNALARAMHA